jgi:hypothetical protein
MRFKALRNKETKEFVEIQKFGGINVVFISELPNPQPLTATIDLMKQIYDGELSDGIDFDFNDFELVEFEMNEVDSTFAIGADIRNKLTPIQNLLALLKIYFTESSDKSFEENKNTIIIKMLDDNKKQKLVRHIVKEMEISGEVVKYLANLL